MHPIGVKGRVASLSTGVFLLTLDTELAWGGVHSGAFRERRHFYSATRPLIHRLLGLLERYEIQSTWAVVGHLFLSKCCPSGGRKHPDLVRPDYEWFGGDWFDADPCSSVSDDPFWYAPDIVDAIQNCSVRQEIGCHGFSHVMAGEPGCSRECFASELDACIAVGRDWGIPLTSFVYPRNSVGHLDLLAERGFTCYRGVLRPPTSSLWNARLRKAERTLGWFVPVPAATAKPRREGSLWNLPGTQFYGRQFLGRKRTPAARRARRALNGIRQAVRKRELFHLWLHPFNLAAEPQEMFEGLRRIFEHVAQQRDRGRLSNPTMSDLAELLNRSLLGEVDAS